MNEYELTVLIHPDLESDIDTPLKKVKNIIKEAGGTVTSEENHGKKRLAYSINRENFAVYVYIDVQLPSDAPQKINTALNITDEVLRYLLVKADPRVRAQREDVSSDNESSDEA